MSTVYDINTVLAYSYEGQGRLCSFWIFPFALWVSSK